MARSRIAEPHGGSPKRDREGTWAWLLLAAATLLMTTAPASADACVIVNGLGGMPEYEENFIDWSKKLEKLFSERLGGTVSHFDGRTLRRKEIVEGMRRAAAELDEGEAFWLFLVGHANHDGERFKFHIKGPDLTGADLKTILSGLGKRNAYVVAATSASGALLPELAGENRVVVTATRNRMERQPPLFLSFFIEAAGAPEADKDKNGRVSLLEAYLFSRQKVSEWFQAKGRIQTEHPLLDDQGKLRIGMEKGEEPVNRLTTGEGLLAAAASLSAPPEAAYRSMEAQKLAEDRAAVEREVEDLKFRKGEMASAEYYQKLEELLVKLATINEEIRRLEGEQ